MCGGLDARLDGTGGQAWSLGQQQLMCLARAALKKVPILCLDEATAAMDPHTEAHVLEIIERIFSDRTTITVAHRWGVCVLAAAALRCAALRCGRPGRAVLCLPASLPCLHLPACCLRPSVLCLRPRCCLPIPPLTPPPSPPSCPLLPGWTTASAATR